MMIVDDEEENKVQRQDKWAGVSHIRCKVRRNKVNAPSGKIWRGGVNRREAYLSSTSALLRNTAVNFLFLSCPARSLSILTFLSRSFAGRSALVGSLGWV